MNINNKKGQVSLFFLLGVIILISFTLIFFVNERLSEYQERTYSFDVDSVYNYAEGCIDNVGYDLVDSVGYQSGFVDVERVDPYSYVDFGFQIPVWFHLSREDIPDLDEIEEQLEKEALVDLRNCINDFDELTDRYDFHRRGEDSVEINIFSDYVSFEYNYPVEVSQKGDSDGDVSMVSSFNSEIRRPLGNFFELAKEITEYQRESRFLENITEEIGSHIFPPNMIDVGIRPETWSLEELERDFYSYLIMNLNEVDLTTDSDDIEGYYSNLAHNLDLEFEDLEIDLMFSSDFQTRFDGTPRRGDELHSITQRIPSGMGFDIPIPGLQITHLLFSYRLPIVFNLHDPNTGYNFNFGLESYVVNNQPREGTGWMDLGTDISSSQACENNGSDVTLRFNDKYDRDNYLENVSVYFFCGADCYLGNTSYEMYSNRPRLDTKLPECNGGFISFEKDGYLQDFVQIEETGEDIDLDLDYSFLMTPMRNFSFEFVNDEYEELSIESSDIFVASFESNYVNEEFVFNGSDIPNIKLPLIDFNFSLYITVTHGEDLIGGYFNDNLSIDFENHMDDNRFEVPLYLDRYIDDDPSDTFLEIEETSEKYEPRVK